MHLRELVWGSFRNLEPASVALDERINVFEGDNGQGKTNLLEAVYWLATLRPLRARRLQELVRFGETECRVEGRVVLDGLMHRLEARVQQGARVSLREGKPCRPSEYFGTLAVVLFSPDDASLLRAPPAERRRYLDRAIFTGRPAHLDRVTSYKHALEARNEALRTSRDSALLESFEVTLARDGAALVAARAEYVEQVRPHFLEVFSGIFSEPLEATLDYRPSVDSVEVDEHCAILAADRERDQERGYTARGPHADDVSLGLIGRSARLYASQGQQRALVLALKIAEIRRLEALFGLTPALLLDDVSSELDAHRNASLFECVHGYRGQVLITTTDARHVRTPGAARTFRVHAGHISPTNPDPGTSLVE